MQENRDSVNPCAPDWLDSEDNALLRGDAIGETAYTHRWILKCLCKVTENLSKYITKDNSEIKSSPISNHNGVNHNGTNSSTTEPYIDANSADCTTILELDLDVEDAACQLWDMTVERDVSIHLLNLEEVDVFQLAGIIMEDCLAPRLTEVMVGVIANLCCQEEACEKVLDEEKDEFLLSTLGLLSATSDVPTLCELMRLAQLLLWHRIRRKPKSTWAACSLIRNLCRERYKTALTFLINSSLSDLLITGLLEFLSMFLYVSLPETGISIASLFSQKELIDGLIDIFLRKSADSSQPLDDDQDKIVHLTVTCLYAFVDTSAAKFIQSAAASEASSLESAFLAYIDRECRVESRDELLGEVSERISQIIGLFHLIIPCIKNPCIIFNIGKVLALIHGEIDQYSAKKCSKDDRESGKTHNFELIYSATQQVQEPAEVNRNQTDHRRYKSQFSNPSSEECGWMSPPAASTGQTSVHMSESPSSDRAPPRSPPDRNINVYQAENKSSGEVAALEELQQTLEDYCYHLLAYWWSDPKEGSIKVKKVCKDILAVLDQCHAHEVLFVLKAVRLRDPSLVPKLQEQLIDSGTHERLVALLAHMYQ